MELKGKVALITGAAVGIGRATAILMAERGASLVLVDIDGIGLENLKAELGKYNTDILTFVCDVSDERAVYTTVKKAEDHFGKIDVLVNNAALWRCWSRFVETSVDEWKKYLDVNIMGVVYFTKAVLPGMLERRWGRVINVSSVAGVYGNANMVHYSATKGALISMTKALAKEVSADGVLVNSVSPGSVSPSDNADIDYTQESALSFIGRTGSGRENAELICFLASDAAGYISGQNIQIDGCRKKQ
ncbi:MAG: SDR family oxidoreductase [Clostridia bacterium]|nr:SDR family oxidoreductase [Clostridia bacterium]